VLALYLVHALAVPVIALWIICAGETHLYRNLAQFAGLFPGLLFLALTAMWTELPGRLSKALLLALIVPVEVGLGVWLMGRDLGFYFVEAFFVDVLAMGVAFVAMVVLQLKDKGAPLVNGCILCGLAVVAFGGPIWDVYRHEPWQWWVALAGMIATDAWAYMYVFGSKGLPFEPVAGHTEARTGLLDRLLPDRFAPVSWGASDAVATPVVIGGLVVWAIVPFIAGGVP